MDSQTVRRVFESGIKNRIVCSDSSNCNIKLIQKKTREWKKAGDTVVFTAGVFDIFTVNHLLGLYNYKMLGGSNSRLIVSIDTDERVRLTKAFAEEKGNTAKPILSWESRALMVAKQSFGSREDLVDLIVQHGFDTCGHMRCPHDDNVEIAECINPDIIVVTSTSTGTIQRVKASSVLRGKLLVVNENDLSYDDKSLNGKISTTAIIERVKHGI